MRSPDRPPWFSDPRLHVVLLVLVAAFFRLWQLDALPPGLFGDEATDGLDALDVLAGRGAVFFPANFGREGLHVWIVAGMFRLLGVTPLAIRLPSMIAGILTVLATYWLGRELVAHRGAVAALGTWASEFRLGETFVPLIAALYVATSFWHVHFSRFGIRGVFTPLCGALAFAALWRGLNEGARRRSRRVTYAWFALAGLFLGLAMHFYTASRFFPIFLAGFLLLQAAVAWATRRPAQAILSRHLRELLVLALVAGLVFLPLGVYFLQHPGSFTQRAGEVAAIGQPNPGLRMAQAAAANLMQFFVPGSGDMAQFYNLPGRAVFDVLTALLALAGMAVLAWRWKRPAALFLLTWFVALLLPSFLATDRFPTLPRVLGVIPAIYFFPALGLGALAAGIGRLFVRRAELALPPPAVSRIAAAAVILVALGVHAGLTYRDYFRVWGPSAATFDAFDGDMVAAWQWLGTNQPAGHVYLSSDIYRHPTFSLLHERSSVQTIFSYQDPGLSMFDATSALPLPRAGGPATYLLAASSLPHGLAEAHLASNGVVRDRIAAPDGTAALTVLELAAADARPSTVIRFTDRLALSGAARRIGPEGDTELWLRWETTGPDMSAWPGYRLEIAAGDREFVMPFDGFRPTEWVPGGAFITWHRVDLPAGPAPELRVRLLHAADGAPVAGAEGDGGWREVTVGESQVF